MIPLDQKLPLDESSSFVARTYRTPYFETPWHQHEEIEIALCLEGKGTCFIGNYMGEFEPKHVYLFGSQLPHWFKKRQPDMICSVLVIQFNKAMYGERFFSIPEMEKINQILEASKKGIKLKGGLAEQVRQDLREIENQHGFEQLSSLFQCLHHISISKEFDFLSQYYNPKSTAENQQKIALIYEYAMNHFQENIKLEDMANLTNMSVSSFCRYFKINTKKSFITFLTEVRIAHACKLLKNTHMSIAQVSINSGFASWANFSKQFKKVKNITPSRYRKMFVE